MKDSVISRTWAYNNSPCSTRRGKQQTLPSHKSGGSSIFPRRSCREEGTEGQLLSPRAQPGVPTRVLFPFKFVGSFALTPNLVFLLPFEYI